MRFDITDKTGLSLQQIPRALRDIEGIADTTSLAAYFDDPTLDRHPAELWIGMVARFGSEFLGVRARQAQDNVHRLGGQVHRAASLVITVQSSGRQIRRDHMQHVSESRSKGGHAKSAVNSGTSAISGLQTPVVVR